MPDLGQLSEELVDFIHPRLKSDVDSVDMITSTHMSLQGASMYWMNVSQYTDASSRLAWVLVIVATLSTSDLSLGQIKSMSSSLNYPRSGK